MLCRLSHDYLIREEEVIGIFDLDRATEHPTSRQFLRSAEAKRQVKVATYNIPRSFVLTDGAVYLAQPTPHAIHKSLTEENI